MTQEECDYMVEKTVSHFREHPFADSVPQNERITEVVRYWLDIKWGEVGKNFDNRNTTQQGAFLRMCFMLLKEGII